MTEKIAFEVRPKKGKKLQKVIFLKSIFWPLGPLGGQKKLYHMKFKSKISYLGEKISILPRKMAEQWAVEVDVKKSLRAGAAGQAHYFVRITKGAISSEWYCCFFRCIKLKLGPKANWSSQISCFYVTDYENNLGQP